MQGYFLQHLSVLWIHNPVYGWAKTCERITWQSWRLCVFHSPFQYMSKSFCKIPIFLSNFDSQHLPLCPPHQYCSPLRIQVVFHVECSCVDVKHKNREILLDIDYTCTLLKVLEHYVFWQNDNSNQPGTMLKRWDTGCKITFLLSNSFCAIHYCFL